MKNLFETYRPTWTYDMKAFEPIVFHTNANLTKIYYKTMFLPEYAEVY